MKKEITAKAAIEIFCVLRRNNIKSKMVFRKYEHYAILKVYVSDDNIIYTKLYDADWLLRQISGMDYIYSNSNI